MKAKGRGSCVFTGDLHLDTYVFHLEKGNFEIYNLSHWFQGYSPFGSYGKGGRIHVEIQFFFSYVFKHMLHRVKQLQWMCFRWAPSVNHKNFMCLHNNPSSCSSLMRGPRKRSRRDKTSRHQHPWSFNPEKNKISCKRRYLPVVVACGNAWWRQQT